MIALKLISRYSPFVALNVSRLQYSISLQVTAFIKNPLTDKSMGVMSEEKTINRLPQSLF